MNGALIDAIFSSWYLRDKAAAFIHISLKCHFVDSLLNEDDEVDEAAYPWQMDTRSSLRSCERCTDVYKMSERRASTANDICRWTLRRYLKKLDNSAGVSKYPLRRLTDLRPDKEEELGELIMDMENRMYGLNLVDVR
ncbi:hypothetical protein LSH36_272g05069 [Paralvinella palmiformis]|uniref:Uncharacterized protein n=1 Tax=Paralvinella palmiformis TaxID=53620 RepID=A0AAD9JKB5_9ANNE|nr:hypothetical protein LSH36_272g05069 [Paralvinella palmiformis]